MGIKLKKKEVSSRVDPDIYKAIIAGVEMKEGQHGKMLSWKFKVKDPVLDGELLEEETFIFGLTGTDWTGSLKANLTKLFTALGIDGDEGEEIDLDKLIGRPIRILVKDNNKDDVTYSKVTDYMKLTKKKPALEPEPEDDEEEEEEEAPKAAKKKGAKKGKNKVKKSTPKPEPEPEPEEEEEESSEEESEEESEDDDVYDFDDD